MYFCYSHCQKGTGDWTIVKPSVMASETGSSSATVPSPGNNNNSTSVSVAGGESRLVLGFFWTNQATLSIILVLGNILLIVNLILFVTIYRRSRCGNCKRNGDDNDVDTENTIQV
jgi:neuroligin